VKVEVERVHVYRRLCWRARPQRHLLASCDARWAGRIPARRRRGGPGRRAGSPPRLGQPGGLVRQPDRHHLDRFAPARDRSLHAHDPPVDHRVDLGDRQKGRAGVGLTGDPQPDIAQPRRHHSGA